MPCTKEDFLVIYKQETLLPIFERHLGRIKMILGNMLPHQTEEMSSPFLSVSKMQVSARSYGVRSVCTFATFRCIRGNAKRTQIRREHKQRMETEEASSGHSLVASKNGKEGQREI